MRITKEELKAGFKDIRELMKPVLHKHLELYQEYTGKTILPQPKIEITLPKKNSEGQLSYTTYYQVKGNAIFGVVGLRANEIFIYPEAIYDFFDKLDIEITYPLIFITMELLLAKQLAHIYLVSPGEFDKLKKGIDGMPDLHSIETIAFRNASGYFSNEFMRLAPLRIASLIENELMGRREEEIRLTPHKDYSSLFETIQESVNVESQFVPLFPSTRLQ
jgi:hypothetical protein